MSGLAELVPTLPDPVRAVLRNAVWTYGPCPKQLITEFVNDPAAPGPACTVPPPTFEP